MHCPVCRDEFRTGFTRCSSCGVDLVEDLAAAGTPMARSAPTLGGTEPMIDYCGFLELGEAREARERLRTGGIAADILIREEPGAPAHEEYWLRVAANGLKRAPDVLGYDPAGPADEAPALDDDHFSCSECGASVANEENVCPGCGASFEEG